MLLLLVKNKVYILFYSAPLALPWPSSTAEFFQFFGHSTPQILNIASNHRAVLIRWYNKRIFIKGYSVPREFSGIENYKLYKVWFFGLKMLPLSPSYLSLSKYHCLHKKTVFRLHAFFISNAFSFCFIFPHFGPGIAFERF